jgi:hypothetical protein
MSWTVSKPPTDALGTFRGPTEPHGDPLCSAFAQLNFWYRHDMILPSYLWLIFADDWRTSVASEMPECASPTTKSCAIARLCGEGAASMSPETAHICQALVAHTRRQRRDMIAAWRRLGLAVRLCRADDSIIMQMAGRAAPCMRVRGACVHGPRPAAGSTTHAGEVDSRFATNRVISSRTPREPMNATRSTSTASLITSALAPRC